MFTNMKIADSPVFRLITWCTLYVFYFNTLSYSVLYYDHRPNKAPQPVSQTSVGSLMKAFMGFLVPEAAADTDVVQNVISPQEPTGGAIYTASSTGGGSGSGVGTGSDGIGSVNSIMGAYTYSYPIQVPPGRGGLAPKIALNYNSSGPNGIFGLGWAMSIGSIERSTRYAAPLYTDDDTFVISLKGTSITLVKEDTYQYRLKNEGLFLRVQKLGDSWKATDKDGTDYYFGQTAGSRLQGTGGTFRWHLDRIEDLNGNYMTFTYWKDPVAGGAVYPLSIDYTGHTNGQVPYNSIHFYREPRTDIQISYATYFKVVTAYRIVTMDVISEYQRVRAYKLTYNDNLDPPLNTSYLEEIQLYAGEGLVLEGSGVISGGNSLPPVKATYKPVTADRPDTFSHFPGSTWPGRNEIFIMGDFTGDGLSDFFVKPMIGGGDVWKIYESHRDSFSYMIQGNGLDKDHLVYPGDFNGDGITDIISHDWDGTGGLLRISNGSGFEPPVTGVSPGYFETGLLQKKSNLLHVGDFDGDGNADVLVQYEDWEHLEIEGGEGTLHEWNFIGSGWRMYLSTGNGFNLTAEDYAAHSASNLYGSYTKDTPFVLGDFNGDGKTDFVVRIDERYHDPDSWQLNLSTGSGFVKINGGNPFPAIDDGISHRDRIHVGDFNGDGKSDLLTTSEDQIYGGHRLYLSTGQDFVLASTGSEPSYTHDIYTADFNGDGLTDVLVAENPAYSGPQVGYKVKLSLGDSLIPGCESIDSGYGSRYHTGDFNGDGKSDFLISANAQYASWDGYSTFYAQELEGFHQHGQMHYLLGSITTSLGATTTITYRPSSAWPKDVDSDANFRYMPMIIPTVSSLLQDDNMPQGHSTTTDFEYEGGLYAPLPKEFRGFKKVTVTNQSNGVQTKAYHHLDARFQGRIESSLTLDEYNNRVMGTHNYYRALEYAAAEGEDPRTFVYAWKSTVTKYDDDDSSLSTITTEYDYDNYGNLLTEDKKIYNHKTSNEFTRFVRTDYTNDSLNWILGKPTFVRIDEIDPGDTIARAMRDTRFYYDPVRTWLLHRQKQQYWKDDILRIGQIRYEYDEYGNNTSITTSSNYNYEPERTTLFDYSGSNGKFPNCTTNDVPHLNNLGCTVHRVFDQGFGVVVQETNANNQVVDTQLDAFGRPDMVTYPDLSFKDYEYNIQPGAHSISIASSEAPMAKIEYDNLDRQVLEIIGTGSNTRQKKTQYDDQGRVWRQSLPYRPGSPLEETIFTYDHRGRIERQDNPDSTFRTYSYDGFTTTTIDERFYPKTITKDSLGRLVKVEEAIGGITEYAYDLFDNLIWIIDPLGNQTHITYDDAGRKIAMDDPYMGHWEYDYDSVGSLVWQKDAEGRIVEIDYDGLNRILAKDYLATGRQIDYIYDEPRDDASGNPYFNIGGLTTLTATEPGGALFNSIMYNYDEMGRSVNEIRTINAVPYEITRTYDLAGRLDTIAYPDAETLIDYSYTTDTIFTLQGYLDRVEKVASDGTRTLIADYDYDQFDPMYQIDSVTYGNGASTTYDYWDGNHRLKQMITHALDVGGASVQVQNLEYGFDNLGNIKTITDHVNDASHSFSYDAVNRLAMASVTCSTDAVRAYDQVYTYDLAGNMTARTGIDRWQITAWHAPHPERHLRPKTVLHARQSTGIGARDIIYNQDNKPTDISFNGQTTYLYYDGEGNRVKKVAGGDTIVYVGGLMEIRGSETILHIFANGRRIASINGGQKYFTHGDHLGSTALVTNDSGLVVEEIGYLPFGSTLFRKAYQGGVWTSVYQYTGQEYDTEYELYNYNARLYDPVMGRFITPDTVVPDWNNPQSLNRYAYCYNNPLKYVDPSGHLGFIAAVVVGALIGAFMGGMMAAMNGGDFFEGAFQGAVTGAISGAMFFGAGEIIAGKLLTSQMITSNLAKVAIHSATGALSGAVNAAITGGDLGQGALNGALSAGAAKGFGEYLDTGFVGRVAAGSVTGGISTALTGGDFAEGAFQGAWTTAVAFVCNDMFHEIYEDWHEESKYTHTTVAHTKNGIDFETTIHSADDSNPIGILNAGASTAKWGGGVRFNYEDCLQVDLKILDFNLDLGISKHLGMSFNFYRGTMSINVGLGSNYHQTIPWVGNVGVSKTIN